MGLIKTPEELEQIQAAFSRPEFTSGERLTVEFLTTPETVARLLPPPLEPAATPLVLAAVGRWQSDFVGDYAGGSIYLACMHEGVAGGYPVVMYMDQEQCIMYGREVFGEPKRLAKNGIFRNGDQFHGYLERNGTRILELHADVGEDTGPGHADGYAFNYRARPAADGIGLEGPATLTRAHFDTTIRANRIGTGSVTLRSTPHDPLAEIEVVSVVRAVYQEHDIHGTCQAVATVPGDVFLPYYYGRTDDWLAYGRGARLAVS
jgi:acetoacetate decarboxylase